MTLWKASNQENTGYSTPLVANGLVYEQYGAASNINPYTLGVIAYDAANGKERWHVLTNTNVQSGLENTRPVVVGDAAYMTVPGQATLTALNSLTGAQRWQVMTDFASTIQAFSGQSIYVGAETVDAYTAPTGYTFSAYNASDGKRLWRVPVNAQIGRALADTTQVYTSTFPGAVNAVTAYRASDGRVVWSMPTGDATTLLAEVGGAVYDLHRPIPTAPGTQSTLYLSALSTKDGHVLFNQLLPGQLYMPDEYVVVIP